MKPICVDCQRFYRAKKNGFYFVEGMPISGNPKPGVREPEKWTGYKLWVGDLWECPDCEAKIIAGCGHVPIAEHFEDGFQEMIEKLHATLLVKDC